MSGLPNPYDHWATCGIGSTVTTEEISETTIDFGVLRNVTVTKDTLVGLDAEKATLQIHVQGAANGAPFEVKHTVEIPARPPKEPAVQRQSGGDDNASWEVTIMTDEEFFKGSAPKESTETLEVAGRSLVCRRIERSTTLHGEPLGEIVWWSDEVPGGVVRMEGRMGTGHVTKTTVTAFEKK